MTGTDELELGRDGHATRRDGHATRRDGRPEATAPFAGQGRGDDRRGGDGA